MERMVRKQIYITVAEDAFIKAEAASRRVAEADVIREAIDAMQIEQEQAQRRVKAWAEIEAVIEEGMKLAGSRAQAWKWDREELYEERIGRYGTARVAEDPESYRPGGDR